ncbi:Uncharacterised protein [Yersinia frederiksenii]|jgi:hypothetical protein|nr:Uncharacterised protein [Yersinia frederiksenii]
MIFTVLVLEFLLRNANSKNNLKWSIDFCEINFLFKTDSFSISRVLLILNCINNV